MRRLPLLAFWLIAIPALARPSLELEVGAGANGNFRALSPSFSARAGLDFFNLLTPSVKVMTLNSLGSPNAAWALLGELRAHTRGRLQLTGGIAVGFGTAVFSSHPEGITPSVATLKPWVTADVGARVLLGPFFVGFNLGGTPFNPGWTAMLTVGFKLFREEENPAPKEAEPEDCRED